ncbi:MAG: DUF742 domain-containing protein [Pseudonocardiales bacterium]
MDEPGSESAPIVRPYALTGGRTKPEHAYPFEALVVTSFSGERLDSGLSPEAHAICDLCRYSRSVAEIAAHLRVPLGVTRVLVGDLADAGLVLVHAPSEEAPDAGLLERVLSGLQRL